MLDLPFDPIKRARAVEEAVMQGLARKYYRFRPARYYGGIATADLVGCPFLCAYCWNYGRNLHPEMTRDRYYSPQEVANRLLVIVKKKGFNKVRLSGAEPILGEQSFEHLYQVLNDIYKTNPGREGINAWPAIMYEVFGPEGIGKINQELKGYEIRPEELEIEYLEPYPAVLENLKKRSISLHM